MKNYTTILMGIAFLLLTGCRSNMAELRVPKDNVFHNLDYGLPITHLHIDGFSRSNGTLSVQPGIHEIKFDVGNAKYLIKHSFAINGKYILLCKQNGHGSTALLFCTIEKAKE